MTRLRYLDSAKQDLAEIAVYIARETGSSRIALRFTQRLRSRCRDLAQKPFEMGRLRPELRDDLRSMAFGNYVIFFRYVGETLEIVNILEGHRNIDAFYDD